MVMCGLPRVTVSAKHCSPLHGHSPAGAGRGFACNRSHGREVRRLHRVHIDVGRATQGHAVLDPIARPIRMGMLHSGGLGWTGLAPLGFRDPHFPLSLSLGSGRRKVQLGTDDSMRMGLLCVLCFMRKSRVLV